jgi:pyruvate,water dikinase
MLPGAVTPLTLSLSVYAIDWGMRKMLTTAGAYKKMDNIPPYSCVLPVCNHLFINLSSIYPMTKCVLFATKQDVDYSICGRKIDAECEIIGRRKGFFKRFFNTYKYLGFVMSKNKAKKKITKLANTFSICDSADPQILYDNITGAKHNADIATYYHYATSSHSGSMSSAVFNILERKLHDTEKCKGVLAELLEDIDGIESVDILRSLRKISASGNSQELIDEFMRRHGHRAIREAELRSRGWADDRDAFNEYLRAVSAGSAEIEKTVSADIKQILKRHGFRGMMLGLMKFLAGQSRIGVSNREHSKSMMIKVYNVFKTAYRNLAKLLVGRNLIPDEDLIFFFTHEEIQTVISGEGQSLIKRAIKRRRLLDTQMGLFFEEVYMGKPQPLDQSAAADGATSFTGAAISRGTASGRARVVKTMADAAQLKNGEIMVCTFTDIGWSPYYALIGGLVTEIGSSLSHGAVVAREYGLPLVSNIKGATKIINTGDSITINGTTGTVTIISSGGQTE